MKRVLTLIVAAALLVSCAAVLSGCGSDTEQVTINVLNWGQYISEGDDDSLDVIAAFEEKYPNIKVNYSTYDSNEVLYTKLAAGGVTVDVIIPSDYMIGRMIAEGLVQELNFDNIPNYKYIDDSFKNTDYDPENKYSVPYTWGTVGIIYNTKYVSEEDVTGWELLWNQKYADKILMFDNSRDAFGIAEYLLGYDVNTTDEAELQACAAKLAEQKPVVQQYVMDQIFDAMENEEAWIAPYYAGDYLTMLETNPDLKYVVPEEGSNWFVDAMCVLKDAENKDEAEEWINFLCSTDASLKNMDYIWYASPNKEALEQYPEYYEETYGEELDPELYEIMAAPQEVLKNCEAYLVRPAATRTLYNDLWTDLGILA